MATASVTIERLTNPYGLAEGPHWDKRSQKLYFVDIFANKICSLNTNTGKICSAYIKNGPVGVVVPVDGTSNKFVAGSGRDFVLVKWDSESDVTDPPIKKLASVENDRTDTRFNDGKVDSLGRMWIGTMGPETGGNAVPNRGSLYSIAEDLQPKVQISPVGISNGLDWSLNDDMMFYIDSLSYQVVAFDYHSQHGIINNRRVVFDLKKNNIEGLPDGMTIDTDGNLWIAIYMGSRVIQIDPKQGKLLKSIDMPATRVTSVAFGGSELDILYVTTSSFGLSDLEKQNEPGAGCLYAVKGLGVKGRSPNVFKL